MKNMVCTLSSLFVVALLCSFYPSTSNGSAQLEKGDANTFEASGMASHGPVKLLPPGVKHRRRIPLKWTPASDSIKNGGAKSGLTREIVKRIQENTYLTGLQQVMIDSENSGHPVIASLSALDARYRSAILMVSSEMWRK